MIRARIDCGPGYRVYFGQDGNTVIILLGALTGTRPMQSRGRSALSAHRWSETAMNLRSTPMLIAELPEAGVDREW